MQSSESQLLCLNKDKKDNNDNNDNIRAGVISDAGGVAETSTVEPA